MAKLSPEEQAQLDKLQNKAKAPDAPPMGRSVSFSVNLGNAEEVSLARRLGLIDDGADDDAGEKDGGDDGGDDTPKRRGYFGTES